MIAARLAAVRKKLYVISSATKAQQQYQTMARRRSGEVTPRSVPT